MSIWVKAFNEVKTSEQKRRREMHNILYSVFLKYKYYLQNYLSKLILVHCKGVIMIARQKKGGDKLGREQNYTVYRTDISFLL